MNLKEKGEINKMGQKIKERRKCKTQRQGKIMQQKY